MKLYKVSIERTIMVYAENEDEAENLAEYFESETLDTPPDLTIAIEVTSIKDVSIDWHNGIPYSKHAIGDLTCAQLLDAQSDSDAQLRFDMRQV